MLKFILFFYFFSLNVYSQANLHVFHPNSTIQHEIINENYNKINTHLQNFYNEQVPLNNVSKNQIISDEVLNSSILNVNQQLNTTIPLLNNDNTPIVAEKFNDYFNILVSAIDTKISVSMCQNLRTQTTGLNLLDKDGLNGPIEPELDYCNFIYAEENINNFRIRTRSAGFSNGNANYVIFNETYLNSNTGTGWTITVLDENLNKIAQNRWNTYGGKTTAHNQIMNYLNSTGHKAGLIIITTQDEPAEYAGDMPSFRTALANYSGCSVPYINYRGAYTCVFMRNVLNQKQVFYNHAGYNVYGDTFINYSSFKEFINRK